MHFCNIAMDWIQTLMKILLAYIIFKGGHYVYPMQILDSCGFIPYLFRVFDPSNHNGLS